MVPSRRRACWAAAVLAVLGTGCAGPLLSRDERLEALTAENRRLQDALLTAEARLADLEAAGAAPRPRPAEPPEDPFRAVAVRFGRFTTILEGASPGSGRLKVVLEPLDAEGEVVKRAGALRLEASVEPGAGAAPVPYHTWTFSRDDLAQAWIGSLGVRGYVLRLRWPKGRPPRGEALRLQARFTTLRGEVLEAETRLPLGPAE